jgi:putative CocE/NonD family hydrolase
MSESWPGGRDKAELSVELNVPIEMRDGTVTRADIYRPKAGGRYPVILQRTPYDKSLGQASYYAMRPLRAISRGYVVVIQDVRGRFASDGKFYPMRQEINDGYDTVEWCARQPWSSGKVGMWGPSYVGATQWLAAASVPPHLACIAPSITASNYYEEWFYRNGALQLGFVEAWILDSFASAELLRKGKVNEAEKLLRIADEMDERAFKFFPLRELPYFKGNAEYIYDWLRHTEQDSYWEKINLENYHGRIRVPALNIGGWYDIFLQGTINGFVRMKKLGKTAASREPQLVIGPWMHWGRGPWLEKLVGDMDFTHAASQKTIDLEGMMLDFYDRWMKDGPRRKAPPPVKIFVMGENAWRDEDEWPLARTRYTEFYLHSGGSANTLEGDGSLSESSPKDERPDRFVYDPLDPVPSKGGALCCNVTFTPAGAYDQRPIEERKDVLVYSTPVLRRDIEVTGPVMLKLYASTSAPDTDFTGKLVDVWPCELAQNLTQGVIRARYKDSRKTAKLIRPGKVYEYTVDLWSTSNLFKKGHCIRLEVSSSNFPHFDRNMNTARHPSQESKPAVAMQHVFHDSDHPSRLVLPIIPRS